MADVNETLLQQETLGGNHGYVYYLKKIFLSISSDSTHAGFQICVNPHIKYTLSDRMAHDHHYFLKEYYLVPMMPEI
jgi:hypothetical protein